ncbi:choice-of-anchor I family protein [Olivibacter domesticus]|uniref:Choice-of-anchor I domain-containing protein n=1 Tax=Olivibacter domesticus TaxID=407022 RepID=A0A1H7JA60_OLID1|nr:choice-of-anchor I family protein [Olivibacter domesticus]SEK71264.1 hypothetical protein SAMN05661044_00954 [Olivibacter domesticus]
MYHKIKISLLVGIIALAACKKNDTKGEEPVVNEDPSTFTEIGQIDIGDVGAAEISAFDPSTNRLFVVNNSEVNKIDVIDMKDPVSMTVIGSISVQPYGGVVNSVSVSNGKLAAAIESLDKQAAGKLVVFQTSDYHELAAVSVGALPDMVTFSPDGKYILTANEGEPNADYTNDPTGSISIISVEENYTVSTLDFADLANQEEDLKSKGFRIFGPSNDFAKDIEPEYITVSADSKTAWVTLQENNAIAKINISSKTITDIYPLGFKDYNLAGNEIDVSDKDDGMEPKKWNIKGIYMPDAIAVLETNGTPFLFTANEGDAREYDAFEELDRIKNVSLDPTSFPDAATLQKDEMLGRLNITTTLGDNDHDGDFETLYSLGARSFSVWNGNDGSQVYDSKNELDKKVTEAGFYDDGRSDDKSVEPEGITIGKIGNTNVAFVGMERADAVAVYDINNPIQPKFLQLLQSGDAPEGIMMVKAEDSPTKKTLLIVSSEEDGVIKVYTPKTI